MATHEINCQDHWLHIKYDGEDRDDGCANELSIYRIPEDDELQLLLSNIDLANRSHDNTFALTKQDAKALVSYLQKWLADEN